MTTTKRATETEALAHGARMKEKLTEVVEMLNAAGPRGIRTEFNIGFDVNGVASIATLRVLLVLDLDAVTRRLDA